MERRTDAELPFTRGEEIEFCGDRYTVLENFGESGTVEERGGSGPIQFQWVFQGEPCRRVFVPMLEPFGNPD
jgi:hypothetical protein